MSKNIVKVDAAQKSLTFLTDPATIFTDTQFMQTITFATYFGPTVLWASTATMTFLRDSFYETPPSVLLPCVVLAKPR